MEFCRAGEMEFLHEGFRSAWGCPAQVASSSTKCELVKTELSTGINRPRQVGNLSQNLSQVASRVLSALLLICLADGSSLQFS